MTRNLQIAIALSIASMMAISHAASLSLTWTDTSDNEDGFAIERQLPDGTWSEIAIVAVDTVSYVDTGLSDLTEYTYRLRSFNQFGYSDYTEEASGTTGGPPSAPSNPEVSRAPSLNIVTHSDGSITVSPIP